MTEKFHDNCFACGEHSKSGLKLEFKLLENNTLYGKFRISNHYQGYENLSHGGIISTILVSSMINLFYMKDGLELKTAKLNIRFRKSIPTEKTITVSAIARNYAWHFYRAKSQIKIKDTVFAEAEGYFRE
jgi:hypothetical protein